MMLSNLASLWQTISQAISHAGPPLLIGGAALLLACMVSVGRVLVVLRRIRRAGRAGRAASAGLPADAMPVLSFNRKGHPGDPINMELIGTASQIAAAFTAAGWYRADEIDLVTSVRISVDSLLARRYSTAPVSNLYLFGRKEDLAFERPGRNVRERDHIRLWNTGRRAADGRPIWVAGATRDIKVELASTNHLPTHKIAPDIDAERALVAADLAGTGFVVDEGWRPGFGRQTEGHNGTGDPYVTDGRVAVLTLADVLVSPLATQVRGRAGGLVARGVARIFRWRLPRAGRQRARQQRARQRAIEERVGARPGGDDAGHQTTER
jgi:hypothetical protein